MGGSGGPGGWDVGEGLGGGEELYLLSLATSLRLS